MGSWFGKSEPAPERIILKTLTVKDIIAKVNESHPYVADFLQLYPHGVNYTNAGSNFQ